MTQEEMEARINQINEEYALLPQLKDYDLTLEAVGDSGDVRVVIQRGKIVFEKTFAPTDSLEAISATFGYSEYLTPLSCDIALNRLKMVYFNDLGRVVVERDDSTEVFKVKPHQRERVTELLKERLGNKFKG